MYRDPKSAYFVLKDAIAQNYRVDAAYRQGGGADASDFLLIESCSYQPQFLPVQGPLQSKLVNLAYKVLEVAYVLTKHNYPSSLWRDELAAAEMNALSRIASRQEPWLDYTDLIERIEGNAKRLKIDVPKLGHQVGCGGPPGTYKVKTTPPGGRAFLIPKMFYVFCERTGINPNDASKCDYWLPPIRDGGSEKLGGLYKYRVTWSNRETGVMEVNIDYANSPNETVTLE
jgi:hypothetical protein